MKVSFEQKMAVAAGTSGENLMSFPSEQTKALTPSVCAVCLSGLVAPLKVVENEVSPSLKHL